MLRKLLKQPGQPALLYLHVYQPWFMGNKLWLGAEMQQQTILEYYSIPTVSARNALFHLLAQNAHGFSEHDAHCGVHPNPLGHRYSTLGHPLFLAAQCCCAGVRESWLLRWNRTAELSGVSQTLNVLACHQLCALCRYYGDLVIATLQDQAYAALTVPEEHMQYPPPFEGLTGIPPPMLEENWDYDSECMTGEQLRQIIVPELSKVSKRWRSAYQGARHALQRPVPLSQVPVWQHQILSKCKHRLASEVFACNKHARARVCPMLHVCAFTGLGVCG